MQIADFRRFVENQGLRLTREEVDDLVRATKVGSKNGALTYPPTLCTARRCVPDGERRLEMQHLDFTA